MKAKFLSAALAVAACLGFTAPAAAQPTPDPDLAGRVERLERRVTEVERRLPQAAVVTRPGVKAAACPDGCDCPTTSSAKAVTPAPAVVARTAAAAHAHTCPRCRTTWTHTGLPGDDDHHCPRCGTEQRVVSSFAPPAASPPAYSLGAPSSGGCANGNCAAPAQYGRPAAGRGLLFRR